MSDYHYRIDRDEPIEHRCAPRMCLVVFRCSRADLGAPVVVTSAEGPLPREVLAEAITGFVAWHALNIFPHLNGFQGYDCVQYEFV